jgi:signal transduction histidine kinase
LSRATWAQAGYWLLAVFLWLPMFGAAILPIWPQLGRWLARWQRGAATSLLATREGRSPEWLEQFVLSRRRANKAADAERRRIERNLHDGAQQHILATALTLGRLKSRVGPNADPETLALLDEARRDTRLALRELRELARGLYPPVLTDLGLDAALSAVVANCPVPIDLNVELPERPNSAVEAAVYFTVSEALTNVAKHAAASCATVRIDRQDGWLQLAVVDDGRGGATLHPEGGLGGMRHRLQAMGGDLDLDSPPGGPTSLRAWVPCGSR